MNGDLALRIIASLVAAYLLGGVPWALIIGRVFYHLDVRQEGSGNLGATNVMRVLGWKAAVATAALDIGKGTLAVLLARAIVPADVFGQAAEQWAMIAATLAAMAGHSYSPYIRFRGGKGVAVAGGALLVLTPYAWPILLLTFLLVIAITRMVSLASVLCAIEFPILCLVLYPGEWPIIISAFAAAALVIWRHRTNIVRIARHEEPKLSLKRTSSAKQKGGS